MPELALEYVDVDLVERDGPTAQLVGLGLEDVGGVETGLAGEVLVLVEIEVIEHKLDALLFHLDFGLLARLGIRDLAARRLRFYEVGDGHVEVLHIEALELLDIGYAGCREAVVLGQ